jgi:hypothetical protein
VVAFERNDVMDWAAIAVLVVFGAPLAIGFWAAALMLAKYAIEDWSDT